MADGRSRIKTNLFPFFSSVSVVSGFLPDNFHDSDVDGDGTSDMVEYFTNLLQFVGNCDTCVDDIYEPNDTATDAFTGVTGTDYVLDQLSEDDYWAIDVPAGGSLDVEVLFTDSEGDIDLQLRDSSGAYLTGAGSVSDNETLSWTNSTGVDATVSLRVFRFGTPEDYYCQSYDMNIDVDTCVVVEDFESSSWPASPWTEIASGSLGTPAFTGSSSFEGGWHWQNADLIGLPGDILSAWAYTDGGGRAYLGFDAGSDGAKSFVITDNDIRFQENVGYGYTELNISAQTWTTGWYRMEVEFVSSTEVIGRLYDIDGVSLLNTVSQSYASIGERGIAIRSFGDLRFDDIEYCVGSWLP